MTTNKDICISDFLSDGVIRELIEERNRIDGNLQRARKKISAHHSIMIQIKNNGTTGATVPARDNREFSTRTCAILLAGIITSYEKALIEVEQMIEMAFTRYTAKRLGKSMTFPWNATEILSRWKDDGGNIL